MKNEICGVDESGRGSVVGDVFAAAVILNHDYEIKGLNDSKLLTAKMRNKLFDEIVTNCRAYAYATASVFEIDKFNILNASLLAMKRAVSLLKIKPTLVLVDGNQIPNLTIKTQAIIQGDKLVKEISAASIIAKVMRDRYMDTIHDQYPQYKFSKHKGYLTKEHIGVIQEFGLLPIYRKSFNLEKYLKKVELDI